MLAEADAKLDRLARMPLFAGCDRRLIRAVGGLGDVVDRDPGTVLVEQGRRAGEVLVIVDGAAEVARDGAPVGTLGPGDVVGAVAVLGGRPHTAAVTATTSVELLVFDPRGFRSLLALAPDVGVRMLATIARRSDAA